MDIGLESPVPPICFHITEFPVKIRSDRSIRIEQHPLEPSPEEGEDWRSRGWRNFSKKRKSEEERSWSVEWATRAPPFRGVFDFPVTCGRFVKVRLVEGGGEGQRVLAPSTL